MYLPYDQTWRVNRGFEDLTYKRKSYQVIFAKDMLDSSMMKKTVAVSKSKERKLSIHLLV